MKSPLPTAISVAGQTGAPDRRLWGLLCVLAGNMLIDALEVSVALVALPSVGRNLGTGPATAQWVVSGFAVGFGGAMLFGVRLVERLGRRRVYLAALAVFALASAAAAVASDPVELAATRVVKGVCAALTAPTGLAIILTAFPEGRPRARALSVYTLFGACGFTLGLLLSGALTMVSWRLTFAFPAPVVLLLLIPAARLIPAERRPGADAGGLRGGAGHALIGAACFLGALLALVQGFASAGEHGWAALRSGGALAAAAVLFAVFLVVERAAARPLLRLSALRHPPLARSALAAAGLNGCNLGLLLTASWTVQEQAGWSPLRTAVALVPGAAPLALAAPWSGRLVARWTPARLIALGALFPVAGVVPLAAAGTLLPYSTRLLPALLLVGCGFVLSFAALNAQAVGDLPPAERSVAGGLYQTAVQVGAAVAVVLVAARLSEGGTAPPHASLAARPALFIVSAMSALMLFAAFSAPALLRRRPLMEEPTHDHRR